MAQKKNKEQMVVCPVGKFFMDLEEIMGRKSSFFEHMTRSKIEFLKGMRSLLEEQIDRCEKKGAKNSGRKMTSIKVD